MNYKKSFVLLILILLWSNLVIGAEIDDTIMYGNLLTEAVKAKAEVKLEKLSEYKSIKHYLSENKCPEFQYKGYIVGPATKQYFYLVASKGKSIIIGRHFKAPLSRGIIAVAEFESSTNSCLNLGVPPSNATAMYVTHLKPYPNEFHLLQSNLQSIDLYIGTKTETYVVGNGTIKLSESK